MKITCDRSYLATAVGVASRAVSGRNTLPILSNVLLETQDDRLQMTATDLDTAIRTVIPATVHENGAVAIPANVLGDVVSKLSDAPVTIEAEDGRVTVRSGKSDYTILSLPAEDFPVVPEVEGGQELTLLQAQLKEMLHMTTFAASKEESRSILMGVLFDARGDDLTLVATDTHRLAKKQMKLAEPVATAVSAIIPARPLIELERVLRDSVEEQITIRFGQSQVQFSTGEVTLVSRMLDGQFPNYEKVIPKTTERRITFERSEFLDAVRRVDIVAKNNSQKAILETKGEVMQITAESQDVGKAYEEVGINMDGDDIKIAFNAGYLMQVLGILSDEKATLHLSGALNPGLLRPGNGEGTGLDSDFLYVVMPMQV